MLETKTATFTFVKQGIFCFSRRVPSDVSHHSNASRTMYSLRTRSADGRACLSALPPSSSQGRTGSSASLGA